MKARAAAANLLWLSANAPGWLGYERALRHVRRTQESILRRCLQRNADTAFGRRHRFDCIASIAAFRERVPLQRHEDLAADIERIAAGEQRVLTAEPVILLEPTSGSTGQCKLIPFTRQLQAEFRRGVAPWIADLCRTRPSLLGGPAYWSITPAGARQPTAPGAVSVGFDEDGAYLGGAWRRLAAATLAVPPDVGRIEDVARFRRATLLHLLRARELRLISVWHPSFLSLLLAPLPALWDWLLQAIACGGPVEGLAGALPPDPARAEELSRLRPDQPALLWPRLRLISCWADGHAALGARDLVRLFPGVEIQPKGLLATEAFVSLPFRGRHPLAVTSHFFEFLDEAGDAHASWELEIGESYSVVVTTGGGLYRYRLGDQVRVTGRMQQAPCLQFLGREGGVSDLRGEKLSEAFVGGAVRQALQQALPAWGAAVAFALLAPELDDGAPRYVLFVETPDTPPPSLASHLEAALRTNPQYDWCVWLGQLRPAAVRAVPRGAFERYAARLAREGQRLGGIKPAALSRSGGWASTLEAARNLAPAVRCS